MAEIRKHYEKFERFDTDIYALSVDAPGQSLGLSREMDLPFTLLCDENKEVIRLYHLLNPHDHGGIAYPSVFIIKKSGIIGFRSLDRSSRRIQMDGVMNYFEQENPLSPPAEKVISPLSPGILIQIGRNLMFRGSWKDWKHYITSPWNAAKSMLRKKISKVLPIKKP